MQKSGSAELTTLVRDAAERDMVFYVQAIYAHQVRHGVATFESMAHGRWVDTVFMQRELGAGDSTPAELEGNIGMNESMPNPL